MSVLSVDTIRVKLVNDFIQSSGCMYVDFDYRLQDRGSDFSLYANKADSLEFDPTDTLVLRQLTGSLLRNDRSGVGRIEVEPYRLVIYLSTTITAEEIMQHIEDSIRSTGFTAYRLPDGC